MPAILRRAFARLAAAFLFTFATAAFASSDTPETITSSGAATASMPHTDVRSAPPYGRPNAFTCVAGGVIVDAPTSVPVIGPVKWNIEVQVYNTATSTWDRNWYTSPDYTNVADRVQITAGPWKEADGNPVYSTMATLQSTGRVLIRVYNHFWRADQGAWVYVDEGWFSTRDGTASGEDTCYLDNGPIAF